MRSDLAERIKAWLTLRAKHKDQEPLIYISNKRTGEMLKKDLALARKAWLATIVDKELRTKAEETSFLCFVDAQGRYADFHALRKTFITNLSKSGVSPKSAQVLARHSDSGANASTAYLVNFTSRQYGPLYVFRGKLPTFPDTWANLVVLSLAQHQLQHPDEARKALDEASQVITRLQAIDKNHHDLLIAEILYREAEAKINGPATPELK